MAKDTRAALLNAALQTIGERGFAGASARHIATAAGQNQALVFYHFGTVNDLIAEACRTSTEQRVALYREQFDQAATFAELLAVGRQVHVTEHAEGNVAVLAQLLAGARGNEVVGAAVADALNLWVAEVEKTLRRVLADSPLLPLVDLGGLARAISAGFVGIELLEGVDADGATRALNSLEQLAVLTETLLAELDNLGPVTSRLVKRKLKPLTSN
ncbi:TetR family transcriptional regulator [Kribbella orskensis]|uniref:TetR family transcriptional regulator n=1 Tax=Kribbella orskensis TaxID=2512216 RepID=A0ABY2BPP0_9ACTN|nr:MULTISPECIES: TetR/AcrR family transcriptional regulator [Kribbella]TCN39617.1 TetR family transcriptional regulator [Kribbella sp. VKM Ac-2500]TCO27601.1 TetR family transcriptional regulator [Kribbella orskensis]